MASIRRFAAGYLSLMGAMTLLYFAWPAGHVVSVLIVGLGSAAAIAVGIRRYQPRRARPWWLLAATVATNAVARAVYDLLPGPAGTLKPGVWVVWALHLAMTVLLILGVIGLARATLRGLAGAIDAAVIVLGTGLVAALLIAIPYASTPGIGALWASARVGYVLRDVLILAAGLLLLAAVRRSASVLLLFTGLLGLLTYDMLFRLGRIRGVYLSGGPIELGWLLFFVAIGTAALVPSMATTEAPRPTGATVVAPLRLVPVALAALVPSVVLIAEILGLPVWFRPVSVGVATAVLVLVFIRMVDIALRLRRQSAGERALRDAIADLAAAQKPSDVGAGLDRSVQRLLGPDTDYRLVLAPAGSFLAPAGSYLAPAGSYELAAPAEPYATELLPPELARELGDSGFVLAIPLRRRGSSGPGPGESGTADGARPATLLVRSNRASLIEVRPRLDVLATEAALALERIELNEQVVRHTSETYFRTLVQNSTDVILIVEDDGLVRYASPSAEPVLGRASLRGVSLVDLVRPEDRDTLTGLLDRARAIDRGGGGPSATLYGDWTVPRPGRAAAQVEATCQDLRREPSVRGLVLTLRDVTEQRRLEHELIDRAFRDPMTGLGNRLAFSDRLEGAVRDPDAGSGVVAAIFVDLDDLKVINDGLGHDVGDALLTRVGERLQSFVQAGVPAQSGLAARLGGDEFAVLVTGVTDQRAAEDAAAQIAALLAEPVQVNGHQLVCTASVGVATTEPGVETAPELLRQADLALYAAKAAGKGQACRYQTWMREAVMDRLELRSALEHAIADDALSLEYQPIVALDTGRLVGFEALLRWQHPTRGRLTPDTFIGVAEESGLIAPIGEWVLGTALRALRRWTPGSPTDPYIAVNVSARQFQNRDFVAVVQRELAECGVPAHRLLLEITESLLLRDDESTWHDLQRLRDLGVRVAIDDFGTGYSALSYLRQVPLDIVKLDRLFIQHMTVSGQQRRLVEGIVSLTEVLGLHVVAEGIETELQLSLAKQAGCAYGQGYLFSRPLPEADLREWLVTSSPVLVGQPYASSAVGR